MQEDGSWIEAERRRWLCDCQHRRVTIWNKNNG
jgi:hypothetical protein